MTAILGLAFLAFLLASPLSVFAAATIPQYDPIQTIAGKDAADQIRTIGQTVANIFGALILVLSVIMILVSAFYFVTAGGDTGRVETARNYLIYALVGVAVALVAFALPTVVQNLFATPTK